MKSSKYRLSIRLIYGADAISRPEHNTNKLMMDLLDGGEHYSGRPQGTWRIPLKSYLWLRVRYCRKCCCSCL